MAERRENNPRICIEREALTLEAKRQKFGIIDGFTDKKKNWKEKISETCVDFVRKNCSRDSLKSSVKKKLPILDWLLGYQRKWFLGDLIAGITIGIIHVPQGLGFAMLANVPPVAGIYMAVFPCLIYAILGSSNHCSMGSFAVITLMTGKVVTELATFPAANISPGIINETSVNLLEPILELAAGDVPTYTPFQVATVVAFTVGLWHLLLGLLQMGKLCIFIADVFVSGFTTAAACHVVVSQLKHIFGVQLPPTNGPLRFFRTLYEICAALPTANGATVIIAIVAITILVLNNEILKPKLAARTRIPMPIELILVIFGTAVCYLAKLNSAYDVIIIGEIPKGLPTPSLPPLNLISRVASDSFVIALVSYVCDFSVGKIFATRNGYTVDANQELYAHGFSNIFGSFFLCPPMATALVRSAIIDSIGGYTQLVSLISAAILIPVLLWVGPLFEYLPNAVFASIIIVTLKGMLMQMQHFINAWKVSKLDALMWMVTFASTLIIDIDYGLFIGIIFSLGVLMYRGQQTAGSRLGELGAMKSFVDINKYPQAKEIEECIIYKIGGSLHFANRESLMKNIIDGTGLNPSFTRRDKSEQEGKNDFTGSNIKYLILDLASVTSVDNSAGQFVAALRKNYQKIEIQLCLTGLIDSVYQSMERTGALDDFSPDHLFHSPSDAIALLRAKESMKNLEI